MVLSDNTGWNPGRLVFDLDGFRGGTVSDNAFMFNHEQVQCFARLRHCCMTHVSGNTFVVDGAGPRGYGRFGDTAALGYEQDGERYDTLTMAGCRRLHRDGQQPDQLQPRAPGDPPRRRP